MSIPANATEAPSIPKVWRQLKSNAPTFVTIWVFILITFAFELWIRSKGQPELVSRIVLLPTAIVLFSLFVLVTAVSAIYYATDRCPGPGKTFSILTRRPLHYIVAVALLFIILDVAESLIFLLMTKPVLTNIMATITDSDIQNPYTRNFIDFYQSLLQNIQDILQDRTISNFFGAFDLDNNHLS